MRTLHMMAAVCFVPMAAAMAQSGSTQWPPDSGSRVRIQSPIFSDKTQYGTVMSTRGDTLLFRAGLGTPSTAVGLRDITSIDMVQGRHTRKAKGAVLGFVLGAGISAAIAAATWKKTTGIDFGRGGDAAILAFPGGLVGGVVGLLFGTQATESWVPVQLPSRN